MTWAIKDNVKRLKILLNNVIINQFNILINVVIIMHVCVYAYAVRVCYGNRYE